jgi:hypothetical protein
MAIPGRQQFRFETADARQIVKDRDYLIDNLCVLMLSQLKRRGQGESGRAGERVPNWESRRSTLRSCG